jgi:7-carboxy-7-deazaguanine synthase
MSTADAAPPPGPVAPAGEGRRLLVHERFVSVQGEGLLSGVPSAFLRLSGCNLRCAWCDTPHTSWSASGELLSEDALIAWARGLPTRHLVLTGGEPLLPAGVVPLTRGLRALGLHLTIETAGTVFRPVEADLISLSPKLGGSAPAGPWRARHEAARLRPDVLARFLDGYACQLKFVVSGPADLDEIEALLAVLPPVAPDRVLLMPEGRSAAELDARAPFVTAACLARGWRFCDRLHIRLFGNTPGT